MNQPEFIILYLFYYNNVSIPTTDELLQDRLYALGEINIINYLALHLHTNIKYKHTHKTQVRFILIFIL